MTAARPNGTNSRPWIRSKFFLIRVIGEENLPGRLQAYLPQLATVNDEVDNRGDRNRARIGTGAVVIRKRKGKRKRGERERGAERVQARGQAVA